MFLKTLRVLHAFVIATQVQQSLPRMYSISYNISYMQCSAFFIYFFFTALETLLNREYESEWLIHKWDPDSVVATETPQ